MGFELDENIPGKCRGILPYRACTGPCSPGPSRRHLPPPLPVTRGPAYTAGLPATQPPSATAQHCPLAYPSPPPSIHKAAPRHRPTDPALLRWARPPVTRPGRQLPPPLPATARLPGSWPPRAIHWPTPRPYHRQHHRARPNTGQYRWPTRHPTPPRRFDRGHPPTPTPTPPGRSPPAKGNCPLRYPSPDPPQTL